MYTTHARTLPLKLLGKALFNRCVSLSRSRTHPSSTLFAQINITHSLLLLNVSARSHCASTGGTLSRLSHPKTAIGRPPSLPPSSRLSAISQRTLFVSKLPHNPLPTASTHPLRFLFSLPTRVCPLCGNPRTLPPSSLRKIPHSRLSSPPPDLLAQKNLTIRPRSKMSPIKSLPNSTSTMCSNTHRKKTQK